MNIWILNNYNMLPEQGGLNRHYYFAKCLAEKGHHVTVFVGSHPHNTDLQMIQDRSAWKLGQETPFRWVYVHTLAYGTNRKKQVLSMFQFYRNMARTAEYFRKEYGTPDVILGSSAHPLTALLAVRLGQKYHCKSIAEVRDLWPESIVVYGIAGPRNPAVLALRRLEKWIYKNADALVFTMEGAYDYITEQGWEKDIPRSKVHYINNGVDLAQFDYNKEHFRIEDPDLDDPDTFKVVYAGSIRLANHVGLIVDAAKKVKDPRIRFLIWGAGDEVEPLRRRVLDENITNVVIKGRANKNEIPYITSRADATIMHPASSKVLRFGVSYNKMFEALAAGRPIVSPFSCKYNPATQRNAGVSCKDGDAADIAASVEKLASLPPEEYRAMCANARKGAEDYDFHVLTQKLLNVIGELK